MNDYERACQLKEETIANRWPKVAESNLKTFRAGLAYAAEKA